MRRKERWDGTDRLWGGKVWGGTTKYEKERNVWEWRKSMRRKEMYEMGEKVWEGKKGMRWEKSLRRKERYEMGKKYEKERKIWDGKKVWEGKKGMRWEKSMRRKERYEMGEKVWAGEKGLRRDWQSGARSRDCGQDARRLLIKRQLKVKSLRERKSF
jgi:hypothetical protein